MQGGTPELLDVDAARLIVPRLAEWAGPPARAVLGTLMVFPHLSWGEELLRGIRGGDLDGVDRLGEARLIICESGRYRLLPNVVGMVAPSAGDERWELIDRITTWVVAVADSESVYAELGIVERALRELVEDRQLQAAVLLARAVSVALLPSLWWDRGDRVLGLGLRAARESGSRADELYFLRALAIRRAADQRFDETFKLAASIDDAGHTANGLRDSSGEIQAVGEVAPNTSVADLARHTSGGGGDFLRQTVSTAAARVMGSPAVMNIAGVVHSAPVLVRAAALGTVVLATRGAVVLGSQPDSSRPDANSAAAVAPGTRTTSLPPAIGRTTTAPPTSLSATASGAVPAASIPGVPAEIGAPAPDTITPDAAATADPSSPTSGSSMVKNSGFDQPSGTGPTTVTGGAPGQPAGGKSAAADWSVYNNSNGGTTTTDLVPSTGPNGGRMLRVCTTQPSNEVFQYFATKVGVGPTDAVAEVWVFVEQGRVGMGIGNGGSTSLRAQSTKQGQWELLRASSGADPATEVVIAAIAVDTCFFVDSVSTQP